MDSSLIALFYGSCGIDECWLTADISFELQVIGRSGYPVACKHLQRDRFRHWDRCTRTCGGGQSTRHRQARLVAGHASTKKGLRFHNMRFIWYLQKANPSMSSPHGQACSFALSCFIHLDELNQYQEVEIARVFLFFLLFAWGDSQSQIWRSELGTTTHREHTKSRKWCPGGLKLLDDWCRISSATREIPQASSKIEDSMLGGIEGCFRCGRLPDACNKIDRRVGIVGHLSGWKQICAIMNHTLLIHQHAAYARYSMRDGFDPNYRPGH